MESHHTLIIDTAHPTARVLLVKDGSIIAKREWENTPKVGTELLIYIDEILKEVEIGKENLKRIAVHTGPGSFGLVRTGITTATLLTQAAGAELVGIVGDTEEELLAHAQAGTPTQTIKPRYE